MFKRAFFSFFVIVFLFCFLGCDEPEPEGEWYDIAIFGITNSAYLNMKIYHGFDPEVVYTGNNAKEILDLARYHIDKEVGGGFEEKKTYQEVVAILEDFVLPIDLAQKAFGSMTAYYYISNAGHECAAFVEDTSRIHGRNILSNNLLKNSNDLHPLH